MLRAVLALLLVALCTVTAITNTAAQGGLATPVAVTPPQPIELRVMTFNVWLGGVQTDVAKVVEAIEAAEADVVGLQEAEAHARQIAEALGWEYVDERLQIISRYPLIDPPGANGLYTFIAPRPGEVIAMANVHLPSGPYGPDAVRDGATLDEVLALEEEIRLPGLERHLAELPQLVAAGIPAILTGDFNTPSHLDWTEAVRAANSQIPYAVAWPVGVALAEAGFRDTFREAHPDPLRRPGITWTPGYPHPVIRANETPERIDWVLAAGAVEILASAVVAEADNPDVDHTVMPWPSDHRGVVSALRVVSGEPPLLVAVERRAVLPGDELVVRYHAPGEDGDRVVLVPAGGNAATDAIMSLPPQESLVDGAVIFGTGTLAPGDYEAVLTGADGVELARIPFRVQTPGAVPVVTPEQAVFAPGEPITIGWHHAPGSKWDWIGIYAAGDPDLYNYLGFLYTEAAFTGSVTFDESAFGAPLPPGDYEARLMRDDGYVVLAAAPFRVADEAA